MPRLRSELTDQDLERLARLGGTPDQIAEAAGIDVARVRSRLAPSKHQDPAIRAQDTSEVSSVSYTHLTLPTKA